MRSILIAIYKYKIKYIIVLGHLDCGMTKINIKELRQKLSNEFLKRLSINYSDLLSKLYNFFKPFDNEIRNIIKQMNDLQEIKVYFPDVEITGMLYDIKSGWIFRNESSFLRYSLGLLRDRRPTRKVVLRRLGRPIGLKPI